MGIFSKSKEEQEKEQKEKQSATEKKTKEALERLGIDFDSYSDEDIKKKIKKDFSFMGLSFPLDLLGEFFTNFGLTSHQRIQLMRLSELITQNWVIVRQNELIIRSLEKINNNLSKKT